MIKNILFDFGGVLLNLDFKKSFAAFEALGFGDFDKLFSQYSATDIFQKLETGTIAPEAFYNGLRQIINKPVTDAQLEQAWNAMLLDYRKESLDFLKTISEKYNLYLLSNTNAIHYVSFTKTLKEETQYSSLESFFSKAYFSHEIHRRKPDIETYEFVLNNAGIAAPETLFIDDSYTNFPEAEKLGIQTHLLLPEERIENLEVLIG